jgi:hypothetical protein
MMLNPQWNHPLLTFVSLKWMIVIWKSILHHHVVYGRNMQTADKKLVCLPFSSVGVVFLELCSNIFGGRMWEFELVFLGVYVGQVIICNWVVCTESSIVRESAASYYYSTRCWVAESSLYISHEFRITQTHTHIHESWIFTLIFIKLIFHSNCACHFPSLLLFSSLSRLIYFLFFLKLFTNSHQNF